MASKWKWISTESRNDGGGQVIFDIIAVDTDGNDIPGKHTQVAIDHAVVEAAKAQPTPALRNQALKDAIGAQLPNDWVVDQLDLTVANNAAALAAKEMLDAFVANLGGYPITFTL